MSYTYTCSDTVAIAFAPDLPNWCIRAEEMMTPTLPRVSARIWRKIPALEKGAGTENGI